MPAKKSESQHLEDVRQWIQEQELQNEWEAIRYLEKRGGKHYIQMKHKVCGTIQSNRKDPQRIFSCCNRDCIRVKTEKTCLERYGAASPLESAEILEKIKKTNLERYGVENVFSLAEFRCDPKETWSDEVRKKRENTFLERYGVTKVSDMIQTKEKIRQTQCREFVPRTEEQINAVLSADNLTTFIKKLGFNPTLLELGKALGIQPSRAAIYVDRYQLRDLIDKSHHQSSKEREIVDFLEKNGIETITSWRGLNGKEIDIYIPSLKIGIEFNGLYWHSSLFKDKYYHYNKRKMAEEKDIRLIQIFEDEWNNKQEIIKNKILSICGKLTDKVYARNCIVKSCPSKERNEFLNKYHIQGADRANYSYGLYYKDELIAVMSFIKPRVNLGGQEKEGAFELSRFATSVRCVGGFKKLLTHFIKEVKPVEVYTYADLRWTDIDNNIYLKNGFVFNKQTEPNYFYLTNTSGEPGYSIRENRWSYTKHKCLELFPWADPENTEQEIMADAGYCRIYDCGTAKFSYII